MTDDELDRIEREAYLPSERDTRALVAEVRRLRAELEQARSWYVSKTGLVHGGGTRVDDP